MVKKKKKKPGRNFLPHKWTSNSTPTDGKNLTDANSSRPEKCRFPLFFANYDYVPKFYLKIQSLTLVCIESFLPLSNTWQMSFPEALVITGKA